MIEIGYRVQSFKIINVNWFLIEILCCKKIIVKSIHKDNGLFTVFQPLEIVDELIGGWIGEWMNELITHVSGWWCPPLTLISDDILSY